MEGKFQLFNGNVGLSSGSNEGPGVTLSGNSFWWDNPSRYIDAVVSIEPGDFQYVVANATTAQLQLYLIANPDGRFNNDPTNGLPYCGNTNAGIIFASNGTLATEANATFFGSNTRLLTSTWKLDNIQIPAQNFGLGILVNGLNANGAQPLAVNFYWKDHGDN